MIDDELRQMFTEREPFTPDTDRTTGRILKGIPVHRQRTRRRRALTALAAFAVLAAMLTVPVLLDDDEPRQEALVAASDTEVTLPVTPKWLPEASVMRTFADADLFQGIRTISYELGGANGILAVEVHTRS